MNQFSLLYTYSLCHLYKFFIKKRSYFDGEKKQWKLTKIIIEIFLKTVSLKKNEVTNEWLKTKRNEENAGFS